MKAISSGGLALSLSSSRAAVTMGTDQSHVHYMSSKESLDNNKKILRNIQTVTCMKKI